MEKSDGFSRSRPMDRLKDWPVITMNKASTTHATGDRKKARSSLTSRIKKVRIESEIQFPRGDSVTLGQFHKNILEGGSVLRQFAQWPVLSFGQL